MKKVLLFLLFISFIIDANAQQLTFAKYYDNGYQSQGYSIVKTFDNKYIIAGIFYNEAIVFKIDSAGNNIWNKKIGSHNNECLYSLISTQDSCFVMAGNIYNISDFTTDIFCIKMNANGDTLWTKEIDMGYNDYALSVQQTFDKGYILAGYSSQSSSPLSLIDVVKLDENGNLAWGKTFAESNYNNY